MAAIKSLKTCSFCERSVYRLAARGLCPACYYREKRNGTPSYVKVRKPCSVDGCDRLSVGQGLCDAHYRRLKRHGVVELERFDKWGHIAHHPLKDPYRWITRTYPGQYDARWGDFWVFVGDVGERPTPKHRLVRKERGKPYSAGNVEWRAPSVEATMNQLGGKNAYARAYRTANPERFKHYMIKKAYGIELDDFLKLHVDQDGACAICHQEETALNPMTGMARDLAIDHDHESGRVRGLLCSACNTAIGLFADNPDRLRAAIEYLERHAPPDTPSDEG